ncbi:MAG TPA: hypothetical protein VFP72_17455, partial [Kineosporiaceae bacterium]|nr:hypothetical protein [Kineosporiaceae bacterium]
HVNGDTTFWDALKAGAGEEYADSWVLVSTATAPQFAKLLSLVPTKIALEKLAPSTAAWTEVAGRKFNGVDTVGLRDLKQNQGDTVYVAKDKTGYPVAIEFGKGGGLLTFTDWGKPVTAPTVPDDQIIDATGTKIS